MQRQVQKAVRVTEPSFAWRLVTISATIFTVTSGIVMLHKNSSCLLIAELCTEQEQGYDVNIELTRNLSQKYPKTPQLSSFFANGMM